MNILEESFRTIRTRGVTLSKICGSPRWRQRVFYDYLRDMFAIIYRIPLIRVSIYDRIFANGQIKSVGTILPDGNTSYLNEIVKFIEQKVNKVL